MGITCGRANKKREEDENMVRSAIPYYPHKTQHSSAVKEAAAFSYTDWFAKQKRCGMSSGFNEWFKHRLSSCPNSDVFEIVNIPCSIRLQECKVPPKVKHKYSNGRVKVEVPFDYYHLMGYETVKTLGEGTFGAVMLAKRVCPNPLSKPIPNLNPNNIDKTNTPPEAVQVESACKLIKAVESVRELAALRTELYIMQSIRDKCPYVVAYLNHFVVRTKSELTAFVFMECCNGGDLGDDIDKLSQPYSLSLAKRYFTEFCKGMEFLHKREIAHFDFKPSNVLMQKDSANSDVKHCKITDFGLSRIAFKPGRGVKKFRRYAGTRDFMAPEVLRCAVDNNNDNVEYVAFKADIWSIGVTLYVMLTQEIFWDIPKEFTESYFNSFMKDLREKRYFSYERFHDKFKSFSLADLMVWMLKIDPKQRPTITDCLEHKWVKGEEDGGKKEAEEGKEKENKEKETKEKETKEPNVGFSVAFSLVEKSSVMTVQNSSIQKVKTNLKVKSEGSKITSTYTSNVKQDAVSQQYNAPGSSQVS